MGEAQKISGYEESCTMVKHGGGNVLVWACTAATGVGNTVFIEENMNKAMYLRILKDKVSLRSNFRFYQANDLKHKSIVHIGLICNCPHLMETSAQCPDLNILLEKT